jgi:hypothetical protein
MTLAIYPARSFSRLSRDGGTRRGGPAACALAGAVAPVEGAAVDGPGAGVAGARVQDNKTTEVPTNMTAVRPTMIDLVLAEGEYGKRFPLITAF